MNIFLIVRVQIVNFQKIKLFYLKKSNAIIGTRNLFYIKSIHCQKLLKIDFIGTWVGTDLKLKQS